MDHRPRILHALVALLLAVRAAAAGPAEVDALLSELAASDAADWQRIETRILREWSRSGSPAMDLLLGRGREALEAGDLPAAVEHLTALTDHAPDFAEGWSTRATAFYLLGQYGPALDDLARALALEPRHFEALAGLGLILEEMGLTDPARRAYAAALAIHPHMEAPRQGIARIERAQGAETL